MGDEESESSKTLVPMSTAKKGDVVVMPFAFGMAFVFSVTNIFRRHVFMAVFWQRRHGGCAGGGPSHSAG